MNLIVCGVHMLILRMDRNAAMPGSRSKHSDWTISKYTSGVRSLKSRGPNVPLFDMFALFALSRHQFRFQRRNNMYQSIILCISN
jgi:hypothetical protein